MFDEKKTENLSAELRRTIFKAAYAAGGGHLGGCFSVIDILTVLYFGNVMNINPKMKEAVDRDLFVLSKGHASLALYSVLAKAGFFDERELWRVGKIDSEFGEHPKIGVNPGVEVSTGSLGQGMSFAVGLAYANKIDNNAGHVYVVIGDGESEEGVIWEAAMNASKLKLDNLTVITDYNHVQGCDRIENVMGIEPLNKKWEAFGWKTIMINGHDHKQIRSALVSREKGKPVMIIADTVKGKGVSFMEGKPIWHYRMPNDTELDILMKELGMNKEELESVIKGA